MGQEQGYGLSQGIGGARLGGAIPAPHESLLEAINGTAAKLGDMEQQVNEVMVRLFNPPMNAGVGAEKQPPMSSASERVMDLRSRAIRINAVLADILGRL